MLKKFLSIALIGISLGFTACGSEAGKTAAVEEEKVKIASGTVAATQVMDNLGLDLVGVPTTKTTLPERYKDVQDIGQAFSPNFETIVSLAPDLVVFDHSFKDKVDKEVKEYGLNPFYFNTGTFNDFKNSIVELGKVTKKEEEAKKLSETLQTSVDNVLSKGEKSEKKIKVAILFGTSESYMLASDSSYIGDLVNTIGVDNVTDEIKNVDSAYLNFSMEQVLNLNPDYILRLSHGDIEAAKKAFDDEFGKNPAWQDLDAVKDGKVYDLDSSVFGVTANLKVADAITELGNIIYGE